MTNRPRRPSRSSDKGRIKVVDLLPPRYDPPPKPRAPDTPLFFFGRHDEMTLNWRHWAAPLVVLLTVVTLPLAIMVRLLQFVDGYWLQYKFSAELRRKKRSENS